MLAYYVTAHGYGHGARSCDILEHFWQSHPELEFTVVTDLPEWFLAARLSRRPLPLRRASFDVGMVQKDSVEVDLAATLARLEEVFGRRQQLVRQEAEWLQAVGARAVAVDIPSMPLEAAALAGIAGVAVGNFSWDWIYSELEAPEFEPVIQALREGYARADRLLRFPFSCPTPAFARVSDVPLVAKPGRSVRARLAQATGANPELPWLLFSFTTLNLEAEAIERLASLQGYQLFTVHPLEWSGSNFFAIDPAAFAFTDLMASVEAVVTKPGFGILSEAVVNDTPLIYVERQDFAEYPILEAAIRDSLRGIHLPARDLYAGRLGTALEQLEAGLAAPAVAVPW
ncbi:MAG: hypothetical protein KC910_28810, partial [Candidatus Eremiobacteraeota bacterium]|nr:hypothetical protein [Candidatus Eremiobacteraeota bacterium]